MEPCTEGLWSARSRSCGTAFASSPRPSVRFTHFHPLTVRGSAFRPAERVRVTLTGVGPRRTHAVTTSPAGRFSTVFATSRPYDPCSDTIRVVAVGGRERAEAKLPQRECPPAP